MLAVYKFLIFLYLILKLCLSSKMKASCSFKNVVPLSKCKPTKKESGNEIMNGKTPAEFSTQDLEHILSMVFFA